MSESPDSGESVRRCTLAGVRSLLAAALAVAAAGCGPVPEAGGGAPSGRPEPSGERPRDAEYRDDFNGDGYADLAVLVGDADAGGAEGAGKVVVVYGSADGPDPGTRQVIDQGSEGVPGTPDAHDRFGDAAAVGDFDGDGYADVAVMSAWEDYAEPEDPDLTMLWGGESGLGGGTALDGSALPAGVEEVVSGDFDADGERDLLAYRAGGESAVLRGPFIREGGVAGKQPLALGSLDLQELVPGDVDGDGGTDLVVMSSFEEMGEPTGVLLSTPAGLQKADQNLASASTGAIGDMNGDGYGDLVMREVPGGVVEDLAGDPGTLRVIYGGPDGLAGKGTAFTRDSGSIPGESNDSAGFGFRLAAGDVDGDGCADVLATTGVEPLGGEPMGEPGGVVVLKGGPDGLTTAGSSMVDQDSAGVPGDGEDGDGFGWAMRLADFDGDDRMDLAVGAPGENEEQGAVWALRYTRDGAAATGAYGPDVLGVSESEPKLGGAFARS
ncbi:FG-GAP and VCBS repeat-containing protein [Streptomonospora wellingtoniae]|uniref:FG-GAP repeat protein n=1 Tax=Streptomonospora wellingtoniae TaxID=3075544 RepID=A0ABU2KYG1_9ACTN|nr:FG-GAP repeat protein [Streptomonospora sp. DSM 45055]MDT0304192.1 FG-GAP repeat protein [Streptomonospora sp. DSM 45055]